MLKHKLVVARQVWLTLHSIDNQDFSLTSRRRRELDMRRECSTAKTNDTGFVDFINDCLSI